MEKEIQLFVKSSVLDIQEFEDFSKSFQNLDKELQLEKKKFEAGASEASTTYLKLKRIKDSIERLKPTGDSIDVVLKTLGKIKTPIKFDVTQHNMNIQLLDSVFITHLKDTINKVTNKSETQIEKEKENKTSFNGKRTYSISKNNLTESNNNFLSDKFNIHHSSNSKGRMFASNIEEVPMTTRSSQMVHQGSSTSNGFSGFNRLKSMFEKNTEIQTNENDINLSNFKNIYETRTKPGNIPISKMNNFSRSRLWDSKQGSPNRKIHISTSQAKDYSDKCHFVTPKNKMLEKSFDRKGSAHELKFTSKYQKNVVSIEGDIGTISNQFLDENKLKNVISSIKTVSKNVKKIELVNNTFVCNPIPIFKNLITEKASYVITFDLNHNKILANANYSKRDVEMLKSVGVEILN